MAGFTIPDNDVAGFPLQAQIFELDIEIMAGDAGWVVSGCGVTPQGSPDMTVAVAAGVVRPRGMANVAVTAGNLTVGAADSTLWRIDLISSSSAGVKTITAGTAAAATAVKPPSRPSDHVGLAFVLVPPAGTAISADLITDKRNLSDPGVLRYLDHGNTGASEAIDFSAADVQRIILNSATVSLSTSGWPAAGIPGIVRVYVEQDGVGGRLLSYSAEIDWGDPGEPTLQTSAGSVDIIDLQTIDGGTTVLASMPNRAGPTGAAGADGSVSVATDNIWSTPGKVAVATGTHTASEQWPPGHEFDYAQITSDVNFTATSAAAGNAIITGGSPTLDGSTVVMIEFGTSRFVKGTTFAILNLWEDSTNIARLALTLGPGEPCFAAIRRTPGAGSHTYKVTGYVDAGTGTVYAGAGGVDTSAPAFLRVVKA
jgi:hypothetical protein